MCARYGWATVYRHLFSFPVLILIRKSQRMCNKYMAFGFVGCFRLCFVGVSPSGNSVPEITEWGVSGDDGFLAGVER